jgi:hypothetical protein
VLGVFLHLSIVSLMESQTVPLIAFALTCLPVYGLFIVRPSLRSEDDPRGPAAAPTASRATPCGADVGAA